MAQVPVLAAEVWEMESARAVPAREGASVWVAKAVEQVEALAPGLEEAAAAGCCRLGHLHPNAVQVDFSRAAIRNLVLVHLDRQ